MPKDQKATIHLKASVELRNRILGKLRSRGTTMQSFFLDVMKLIDTDERVLERLEKERNVLREREELVHS